MKKNEQKIVPIFPFTSRVLPNIPFVNIFFVIIRYLYFFLFVYVSFDLCSPENRVMKYKR